jgi:hypothetical protein
VAKGLFDYLTEWLRHHILIQDMAYKPYVSGVRGEADFAAGPQDLLGARPAHAGRMQA